MATKKVQTPKTVHQIKITLKGSKPPIWRRLLVPSAMTLAQLHDLLQAAMGWQDCHLHDFHIGRDIFGPPSPDDDMPAKSERTARIFSVLGEVGAQAQYNYDFGDDWQHSLVVEKILAPDPAQAYPLCTGGKMNCPPEDCGGIYGYYEMLEALSDPEHENHENMVEWIGKFDPKEFSVDEVNERLAPVQRRGDKM